MPENNEHIELRSDEVQEIMSHVPNWMIRWGITLIFGLLALLIFISWFIKYPDTIQGSVSISTEQPPIKLLAKNPGELENISFIDHSNIEKGDVIATLGHSFSVETRDYLLDLTKRIEQALGQDEFHVEFADEHLSFGSIQSTFIELKRAVQEYENYLNTDPTAFEIATLKEQIENHTIIRSVSYEQLNTAKKELENTRKKYEADQRLYEQNVISRMQLYEEEKKFIQAETNVGNYKKAAVQSSITITDLKTQLNSLVQAQKQKQTEFIQRIESALATINNAIEQWGQGFQVTSPIAGELNYLENVHEHDYIETGTALFAVVPTNQDYIGYMDVPKTGYGKIKVGHKVRIRIDKYPYHEYGQLEGVVMKIALLPNEDVYRVTFRLENGLTSSYGREFEYTPEMSGTADIITDDLRLLDRIFNKFRKVFD